MVALKGGDKLEAALSEIAKKLTKATKLSVGFMADATYPDGTSVAMVAALDEYGHGKTPPRPFFRTMIAKESGEWGDLLAAALKATDGDVKKALGQLGAVIVGQLQQSIIDTHEPALSSLTLMLRGMRSQAKYREMPFGQLVSEAKARLDAGLSNFGPSTKPLIDTGVMLRSIDSVVE